MIIESGLLPGHVLQRTPRGARAVATGTTTAIGPVTATIRAGRRALRGWAGTRVGTAGKGRFTATVAGIPAGGPYAITLACGRQAVTVDQVFVGDLWLMAGQSNMEGVGLMAGAPEPHPLVRCLTMARRWEVARDPLHFLAESPDPVHRSGPPLDPAVAERGKRQAPRGSGVGVPFGILMQARTGVPQGLIATAHGGTSMEQWDPARRDQGGGSLYGSMLLSLRTAAQPLAGVLWYQGCSDTWAGACDAYLARMQALVAAVRADLGQPRLPWLMVQIGRVVDGKDDHLGWNRLQDLQRQLPGVIRHLDVVPAVDLELDDAVHIGRRSFPVLAERLARLADRLVLGDPSAAPAIQPRGARLLADRANGPVIEVRFANVVGGLASAGLPRGFALIDQDHRKVDRIHKTTLDGDRAHLWLTSDEGLHGLRVMYGWGRDPACTLVDGRGMAVPVCGPLPITGLLPISPWFRRWRVSGILPGEAIARLARPQASACGPLGERAFTDWHFVNLHPEWEGHSGHAAFFAEVDVPEDMAVEVRTGYDGPIRLWIGTEEVLRDLKGTNPAIADARRTKVRLRRGRQPVTVLMALNGGAAWGFFLRLIRTDGGTLVAQPA